MADNTDDQANNSRHDTPATVPAELPATGQATGQPDALKPRRKMRPARTPRTGRPKAKIGERSETWGNGGRATSTFDAAKAKEFCERIKMGATMELASQMVGVPTRTVYAWMSEQPDFARDFALARLTRTDRMVEESIAELYSANSKETAYIAQVRVSNILKIAAVLNPAKYSERILHAHMALNSGSTIAISVDLSGDKADN